MQVTLGSICTSITDLCPGRIPEMYGKNLTFKTGGMDGCDCGKILSLIEQGKIDTTTRCFRLDGVIKVTVTP